MPEFEWKIVEKIAVLSTSAKGWTKELNLISWNNREPKYDVREWNPDGTKMGKGVTLSAEEAAYLKKALNERSELCNRSSKTPYPFNWILMKHLVLYSRRFDEAAA
ncbi:MAG: hypothetical protein J6O90_04035, partial [Candidatus Methanomethylophilaceae archaeon]|nr:hypothetical protein [Candidatus Methanomethylophilaceae archaeon]